MDWGNEPIRTKEELLEILCEGGEKEMASLWKGKYMDRHYRQYEVEGFGERRKFDDGTENNYEAVYSLNDGKVSDKMLEAVKRARLEIGAGNVWVYTNPEDGREYARFTYHNGTNGIEGNALNSMRDAADKLEFLQSFTAWATLTDAFCDTADDVYGWDFIFHV